MNILGLGESRRSRFSPAPSPLPHNNPNFIIRIDEDAAMIVASLNFSIRELAPWVAKNQARFDRSFVRYGGLKRLNRAIQILERGVEELDLIAPGKCPESDVIRAWTVLAMAAGVRDDSVIVYDSLREVYVGRGTIPFPGGRIFVTAEGLGHTTETITCETRLISFSIR